MDGSRIEPPGCDGAGDKKCDKCAAREEHGAVLPELFGNYVPCTVTFGVNRLAGQVAADVSRKFAGVLVSPFWLLGQAFEQDGVQFAIDVSPNDRGARGLRVDDTPAH